MHYQRAPSAAAGTARVPAVSAQATRCPICGTGLAAGSPEAGPTRGAGRLVLQESKNANLDHMKIVWRMPVLLLECRCVLLLRALCLLRTFPPRTRFLMHRGRIFLLEKNPLNDELNEGTPFHLFVDELVDCLLGHTWTPRFNSQTLTRLLMQPLGSH